MIVTDSFKQLMYIIMAVMFGIMVYFVEDFTWTHYFMVIIGAPIVFKLEEIRTELIDLNRTLRKK
jgi:type IV secretory pathway VirB2 component (pilin)